MGGFATGSIIGKVRYLGKAGGAGGWGDLYVRYRMIRGSFSLGEDGWTMAGMRLTREDACDQSINKALRTRVHPGGYPGIR